MQPLPFWQFTANLGSRCRMLQFSKITLTKGSLVALLLSQACWVGGCEEPSQADVGAAQGDPRAWTGYTSEEYPPLVCPNPSAVRGIDCTGSYCDNLSIDCGPTGRTVGEQTWLPYFSEEGDGLADEGHCSGGDMWMTGLACQGSYCDNISMLCSQLIGSGTGGCAWSNWYSEEQEPFNAPSGYYVKGIECSGDYCDNKRYQYCWMF